MKNEIFHPFLPLPNYLKNFSSNPKKVDPTTVIALKDLYKILNDFRAENEKDEDETLDETLKELSDVRLIEWKKLAEVEESRKLVENLEKKIENLLREEKDLKEKIDKIQENFDSSTEKHQENMDKKDQEIKNLKNKMEATKKMIGELLEIKSSLDAEIKIYKALLDSESDPLENLGKVVNYLSQNLRKDCNGF